MSLGNDTRKDGGAEQTKPSAEGIHDNPVSGNHQASSQCKDSRNTGYLPHSYPQAKEGWMGWEKA